MTPDLPEPAAALLDLMRTLVIDHPTVPIMVMRMDRDDGSMMIQLPSQHIYEAAVALPVAYGAATVTIGADAYRALGELNPRTGEPWGHGDMEAVAQDGGLAAGELTECINVVHGQRVQPGVLRIDLWSCGYVRREDGLWWTDVKDAAMQGAHVQGGLIPEAVERGLLMDEPPMLAGLDRAERARFTAQIGWQRYEANIWVQR